MAKKQSLTGVMPVDGKPINDAAPPVIPDENSAPPTSKREAARLRVVSVKQAATLLGRDRNTIQKWLDQGCPYLTKADRDLGVSWELDLGDVVRWLEERAGAAAAAKFGDTEDGKMTEDEAKRRRAVAQAVVAELDMLERLRAVVPISGALDWWAKDYAEIKARAMALPDKIAVAVDPSLSDHVRAIADKAMREVLGTLKTEKSLLNWT